MTTKTDNSIEVNKPIKTPNQVLDENDLTGKLKCYDADANERDRQDIIYAMELYASQFQSQLVEKDKEISRLDEIIKNQDWTVINRLKEVQECRDQVKHFATAVSSINNLCNELQDELADKEKEIEKLKERVAYLTRMNKPKPPNHPEIPNWHPVA